MFWVGFEKRAIQKRHLHSLTSAVDHNSKNEQKKTLHFTYKKLNGRTVKRKVTPSKLTDTHVAGYDHHRGEFRSYILDRMKHVKAAG